MYEQPTQKPRPWTPAVAWVKQHKKVSIAIGVALLLIISGSITYFILTQKPQPAPAVTTTPEPEPEPVMYYSPLTGNQVADQTATEQAVTAIMIENSPAARPQSGLKQAGLVYEAIAEGGITRFLALYQESKPKLVGPVRSLRMYYVDWLAPFNASVAHVGGSAAALKEVRSGGYRDIDQFFNADTYWRASDRYAPHNVYTNFKRLDALNKQKGFTTSTFTGFTRTDPKPREKPNATAITMNFSGPTYNTSYKYDKKTNTYKRHLGGESHKDREEGQIAPSVVIALNVDEVSVMEDGYRESIKTSGSGKATIFQNGTVHKATWHKKNRKAQLTFTDADGKDIPLVRGQTWIGAIPNGKGSVAWR